MRTFEVITPPTIGLAEAEQALGMSPDHVAHTGMQFVDDMTGVQYLKRSPWVERGNYGFVTPVSTPVGPAYLRALYPSRIAEDTGLDLVLPNDAAELSKLLEWQHGELTRLGVAGIETPPYLPVIVKDSNTLGKGNVALFTLVRAAEGKPISEQTLTQRQASLLHIASSLLRFYTEPETKHLPVVLADLAHTSRYVNETYVGIEPLTGNVVSELRKVRDLAEQLLPDRHSSKLKLAARAAVENRTEYERLQLSAGWEDDPDWAEAWTSTQPHYSAAKVRVMPPGGQLDATRTGKYKRRTSRR